MFADSGVRHLASVDCSNESTFQHPELMRANIQIKRQAGHFNAVIAENNGRESEATYIDVPRLIDVQMWTVPLSKEDTFENLLLQDVGAT